jgi:transaldolase
MFRDGRVSIEVDPSISGDADRTAAEARGLWWLVDRPNLFIKIPATIARLPAIAASIADGISVNVTLIFSLDRYRAVLNAFLTGLEHRQAAGGSLAGIESVASFFISRVDTEVDRQLGELAAQAGDADRASAIVKLRGQAALANARLAYEIYEQMLTSDRWKAWLPPVRVLSACFGRRQGSRTRRSATRAMSSIWLHPIPSTPCPKPRWSRCGSSASLRAPYSFSSCRSASVPRNLSTDRLFVA